MQKLERVLILDFEGMLVEKFKNRIIVAKGSFSVLNPKDFVELRDKNSTYRWINKGTKLRILAYAQDFTNGMATGTTETPEKIIITGRLHEMLGGGILLKEQKENQRFIDKILSSWKTILISDCGIEEAEEKVLEQGDYIEIEVTILE